MILTKICNVRHVYIHVYACRYCAVPHYERLVGGATISSSSNTVYLQQQQQQQQHMGFYGVYDGHCG
jgi:hypothetical protein